MKNLIALIALFIASVCFAQQPPLPSCITNVIVTLTDTNAYFDTGGGATNGGTTVTAAINYHGCSASTNLIGNVFLQCDVARHCQNNENIWSCPSGNVIPIYMPPSCNGITITVASNGGCCDASVTYTDPQSCDPQAPNCGGPQP